VVSGVNTRKDFDQGGFSCTVLSCETDDFAVANTERYLRQDLYWSKPFTDTFDAK
jgi:hypothetical protein